MTTHKFSIGRQGALQARFQQATSNLSVALLEVRDLAAQLEAEEYLARLFGEVRGIRPQ
ncbi:hypothetical protein [Arvimicrobium flavum]|uniref:hypothetical protein n=1 Tax=Arvimicrobium flavum TaxID=3393320 RepID=UPI00237A3350|nr:hypothetical protein [Mesorhizobium shangrilense]